MSSEEILREWDIVIHHHSFWPATLRRLPILLPALVLGAFGTYKISINQKLWDNRELTFLFHLLTLLAIALINLLWHWIYRAQGVKLFHYAITSKQIFVGSKKYLLEEFERDEVLPVLQKASLPPEKWRKVNDAEESLVLLIPYKNKRLKLNFANETTRQLAIRTLEGILKPKLTE